MKYMFDTNIFNQITDGSVDISRFPDGEYIYTNLQEAELRQTRNQERRELLLGVFRVATESLAAEQVDQRSTPWGSPWESPWDAGGKYYDQILHELESKKSGDRGNSYDAVTIEACLYEGGVFVSSDCAAICVAADFGVSTLKWNEFYSG